MKKLLYTILLLLPLAGFNACDKGNLDPIDPNALLISASADTVVLNENTPNAVAIEFTWTKGTDRGAGTSLSYLFKMDMADNQFATTVPKENYEDVFKRSFTHAQLFELITEYWKQVPGVDLNLEAKITGTVHSEIFMKPEVSICKIHVKTYPLLPKPLFIVGTATAGGDDPAKATPMENTIYGKRYYWKGTLKPGKFKFITQINAMLPSYNKGATDSDLVLRQSLTDPDNQFEITEEGTYSIQVQRNTLKIAHGLLPFDNLYIVGNGCDAGWDINNPLPFSWTADNPSLFIYEGNLREGEIKLPLTKGNWGCDYIMPPSNGTGISAGDDDTVVLIRGGNPDNKWKIGATQAGRYRITVDLKTKKIKFNKQ